MITTRLEMNPSALWNWAQDNLKKITNWLLTLLSEIEQETSLKHLYTPQVNLAGNL